MPETYQHYFHKSVISKYKQLFFLSCFTDQKKLNSGKTVAKSMCTSDDSSVQMNKNEVYELVKGMPILYIYEN